MDAIRVVLGEENFLTREGMTRVLERLEGIEVVASCGDLDTLRAEIERTHPDVVVADVPLPPTESDEDGVLLAEGLRTAHPGIGLVLLSRHSRVLEAESEEMERTIRDAADGGTFVDPRIVDGLVAARRRHEPSVLDRLTPRELEILGLIAEGQANRAIAERLGITKRAVERHINGIFGKLDLGESKDVSRRVKAALVFLAGEERADRPHP